VTEQILICYDGSDEAKRAVETAAALLGPRRAVVLNVAPAMTSPVPGSAFEGLNKADALLRAEAGAARARRAGFDAEPRTTRASSTWKGIVAVADELDAEIIVIGSRSLNGVRELAHHSVSRDVGAHARQPVLIVPSVTT
jgi:nucleotide-binding universal stress UspA family protein